MELKTLALATVVVFCTFYEAQSAAMSQLERRQRWGNILICPLKPGSCPTYVPGEEKYYPYPGDAARYCQCAHGVPVTMDCPSGLHWNSNTNYCDWPHAIVPPKEPEPVPEPAPAPEPEPVPEPAPAPELAPVPETEPAPEIAPVPEPAPVPEIVPVPEPAPVPEIAPVPEPAPAPEPAPVPETEPAPEIAPVPEPAPVPEIAPVPEPAPVPEIAPVPETVLVNP